MLVTAVFITYYIMLHISTFSFAGK